MCCRWSWICDTLPMDLKTNLSHTTVQMQIDFKEWNVSILWWYLILDCNIHWLPVDILFLIIVFQQDNAYVYVYKRINTSRNLGNFAACVYLLIPIGISTQTIYHPYWWINKQTQTDHGEKWSRRLHSLENPVKKAGPRFSQFVVDHGWYIYVWQIIQLCLNISCRKYLELPRSEYQIKLSKKILESYQYYQTSVSLHWLSSVGCPEVGRWPGDALWHVFFYRHFRKVH